MPRKLTQSEAEEKSLKVGIRMVGNYVNSRTKIEFECPFCKKIFLTTLYCVWSKHTKSCGCHQKKMVSKKLSLNLENKKFGKLTVIKPIRIKNGKRMWLCLCDCGNETIVSGTKMKNGHTRSCGCYRKEKNSILKSKNLFNQKFGKLLVIDKFPHKNKEKRTYWNCICECGKITQVSSHNLLSGQTKSCGCVVSKGENKIVNIFTKYKVKFEQQQTFEKCRNPKTNFLLRFDFYLPTYSILVEYNGSQHYVISKSYNWEKTKERAEKALKHRQKLDQLKRDFCKKEGIELLEIPYWEFNKIEEILVEKLNLVKPAN